MTFIKGIVAGEIWFRMRVHNYNLPSFPDFFSIFLAKRESSCTDSSLSVNSPAEVLEPLSAVISRW